MDDCISRAAAINAICEDGVQLERHAQYSMTMVERKQRDVDILEALPPVSFENHDEIKSYSKDTISRQAAIDALEEYADRLQMVNWKENPGVPYKAYALNWCINTIRDLPSAQPEIIRCKDCKHYKFADNRAFGFPVKRCEWTGFEDVDNDDFCSRAERRTE